MVMCIPTYNRAAAVEDTLNFELDLLKKHDIDLYLFDSSEDDLTESMAEKLKNRGYQNLYYFRVDSLIPSNVKVYDIFERFGEILKYDYVWVIRDYTACTEDLLVAIENAMQQNADIIITTKDDLNETNKPEIITDKLVLLEKYFWTLTMYGAVVLNRNTMLSNVDWKYYRNRYLNENTINFSHAAFYFDRISNVNTFIAINLGKNRNALRNSPLREGSGWIEETIRIWTKCFYETLYALPNCYINKDKALSNNPSKVFLNNDSLIDLKARNALKISTVINYRKYIAKVADRLSTLRLLLISVFPTSMLISYAENKELRYLKQMKRSGFRIALFGVGMYSKKYAEFMISSGIDFDFFVVTNPSPNQIDLTLMNHRIVGISELKKIKNLSEYCLVLGTIALTFPEIKKSLRDAGFCGTVYDPEYIISINRRRKV
jgi:hypothetical protein